MSFAISCYESEIMGCRAYQDYRVINLWEIEGETVFEQNLSSLLETILANKFPDLTKEMIMQLLDLKQTDITQSRFYQEIRTECLEEGLQEGRQEQAIAMVIRQLTRRLGELSERRVGQIRKICG
ncbi:Rpn family recombination-promoting nuclease/putative transposase [Cylindrospermopsis raciborskii Cr2010]|nr:Rpn family recombination-promoting nuclease/putative transposase [Cylindrospermopsis raciborskii Cr2010]